MSAAITSRRYCAPRRMSLSMRNFSRCSTRLRMRHTIVARAGRGNVLALAPELQGSGRSSVGTRAFRFLAWNPLGQVARVVTSDVCCANIPHNVV
jgi:hypothetical protein